MEFDSCPIHQVGNRDTWKKAFFPGKVIILENLIDFRPMAPRRTRSEMDLNQALELNDGPYPEGEFYTAVGPDGENAEHFQKVL